VVRGTSQTQKKTRKWGSATGPKGRGTKRRNWKNDFIGKYSKKKKKKSLLRIGNKGSAPASAALGDLEGPRDKDLQADAGGYRPKKVKGKGEGKNTYRGGECTKKEK